MKLNDSIRAGLAFGLLFAWGFCCMPPAMADNWKVLERSEKNSPSWTKELSSGHIVVTGEGRTLEEARKAALDALLARIITSVATNVESRSSQTGKESFEDGISHSSETFESSLEIAAARLPFIKGVSLSEASGIYWEKLEDKKSRRTLYKVDLLYPLSESQLEDYRRQFEDMDAEKRAELRVLKEQIPNVSSAGQISEAESRLTALEEYFFDKVRRKEAEELRKQYAALYRSISISGSQTGPGEATVRTLLDGKPFAAGVRLKVTSECASAINATPQGDGSTWIVSFDTSDCLPMEQNTLEVSANIKSARLKLSIPIEVK